MSGAKLAYFTANKTNLKKVELRKGGGTFQFHRNELLSGLCRVLRSSPDWGLKKLRFCLKTLWAPLEHTCIFFNFSKITEFSCHLLHDSYVFFLFSHFYIQEQIVYKRQYVSRAHSYFVQDL